MFEDTPNKSRRRQAEGERPPFSSLADMSAEVGVESNRSLAIREQVAANFLEKDERIVSLELLHREEFSGVIACEPPSPPLPDVIAKVEVQREGVYDDPMHGPFDLKILYLNPLTLEHLGTAFAGTHFSFPFDF